MKLFDNYVTGFFFAFFLILAIWSAILWFTGQHHSDWNYLFNAAYALLYFSVGIVALFGVKMHDLKSAVGKELFSIAIAMFGFAFGLFIWSYFNIIAKIPTPYPSLADFFFVLYIPFLGYGIINLLSVFGIFYSKRILTETIIIFILAAILIYFLGNPPDLSDSLPLFVKALNIFYLLGDAFLMSLGYMLIRLTQGRIHGSFFYLIGAVFIMAFADVIFSYRTGTEVYWNGDISDVLYALSGFFFSIGVTKIVTSQIHIKKSSF